MKDVAMLSNLQALARALMEVSFDPGRTTVAGHAIRNLYPTRAFIVYLPTYTTSLCRRP
jgi:hypothetical protein